MTGMGESLWHAQRKAPQPTRFETAQEVPGNDSIDGGSGFEMADYTGNAGTCVIARLDGANADCAYDAQGDVDTLINIEGREATSGHDDL